MFRAGTPGRWTAAPSATAAVTSTAARPAPGTARSQVSADKRTRANTEYCRNVSALAVPFDLFVFSDTSSVTPDKSAATGEHQHCHLSRDERFKSAATVLF